MSAQRSDDDFAEVGSGPDVSEPEDPDWSDEVFDLGAKDYVDAKEEHKRKAKEAAKGSKGSKRQRTADDGEVMATYRIHEKGWSVAVKLLKIGDGGKAPKFLTCHKNDLITDNPFVDMDLVVDVSGLVPKVIGTLAIRRPTKISKDHWDKFVFQNKQYPWSKSLLNITGPLTMSLPPEARVLGLGDDYYAAATHFGTVVAKQLPPSIWKAIAQAKNNDFLLLGNLGTDVPRHLRWAEPVCYATKDTPEAQAARVYGQLNEAYEKGQMRSGEEELDLLIKWGLVDGQGNLLTHPENLPKKAECHHFDCLLDIPKVMHRYQDRKTLYLVPSQEYLDHFSANGMVIKNIATLIPKFAIKIWTLFDTVVCVMAEHFSNQDWQKIPPVSEGKLVCLGDMKHKITSPYNDYFYGGFFHLCALNTPECHSWPFSIDGNSVYPAALFNAIIANQKRLLMAPHPHYKHYANCKDWYSVVAQVKGNMPNNQRNAHTAIMPKNTLILCASQKILEEAQAAFLTKNVWKGTLEVSKAHPLWSFLHGKAMKIQSYTDTELRNGQTVWPLEGVDGPRQYRLQNLTTINQCNALPAKNLVIIIDETTKRSEIARALKYVDCNAENSMVKIFWTPESKKRSFDYLEL